MMKSDLYNHGLTEEQFYAPFVETDFWERPSTWISVPDVESTQNIAYFLCRIVNDDQNWVHLLFNSSVGNYTVDWGDGSAPQSVSSNFLASKNIAFNDIDVSTQQPDGTRQCLITVTFDGEMTRFSLSLPDTLISVGQRTQNSPFLEVKLASTSLTGSTLSNFFNTGARPNWLEHIVVRFPSTSTLLRIGIGDNAFSSCSSLRRVDIEGKFVGGSFSSMFNGCRRLRRTPSLDLADDATGVNMSAMFQGCSSLIDATGLPPIFYEKATNTISMFVSCSSLVKIPPVLNIPNAMNTTGMFSACTSLPFGPRLLLPASTSIDTMFETCRSLKEVPEIFAPNCVSATTAFQNCQSLERIGSITFSTSSRVRTSNMFSATPSLRYLPAINFQIDGCAGMFSSSGIVVCPPLTLNLVASRSMHGMFQNCTNLVETPQFTFIGNLPDITSNLFSGCSTIRSWTPFNTSQVTTFTSMFQNCHSLMSEITLDLTSATSVGSLFATSSSLKKVTLTNMPSGIASVSNFFSGCTSLEEVDGFNLAGVSSQANVASVFLGCNSLKRAQLTGLRFGNSNMLSNTGSLSREGIVEILTSLGTAVGAQTITFSGTNFWGPSQITAEDKAIATAKGWTIAGTA